LLAVLFMPKFRATAKTFKTQTNLVVVCSELHCFAKFPEKSADRILESLNDKTKIESLADRYQTTKLLEVLFVREFCSHIAVSSTEPINPIVNLPNPGLNDNAVWQGKPDAHISIGFFNLFLRAFARPVEKGARTLVTAAAAGEESHGSYLSDQVITEPAPFVGSTQGAKVGRKLFAEVMGVLEEYVPGCRSMLQGD
jgi:retinol dehydrogenase 12